MKPGALPVFWAFCLFIVQKRIPMPDLLTAARMRALEAAEIRAGRASGETLMERAGRGVLQAVLAEWPELAGSAHRAVILCGPGNNGGDGFVLARLLAGRGWQVTVYLYGDAERLPPDARLNHDRWRRMGDVLPACGDGADRSVPPADLMVDAVFGTGLTRAVDNPCLWEWFWLIDDALDVAEHEGRPWMRTVAVDLPSGLDTDTGAVIGGEPEHGLRAPRVMLTVTFHREKRGHRLGEGPEHCGRVVVADIGLKGG